jgi:putative ABC transport system permease protein
VRALDRKLLRDLWHMRGQLTAIALVILCGVATYVMFIAIHQSLRATQDDYYRQYRFADVFVTLKRAPETLRERIAALPGVAAVETRVVAGVTIDIDGFPDPVTGTVVSLPDEGAPALNALFLRQGRMVDPYASDEIVVGAAFAEAHGLAPGDTLRMVINGRRTVLTIVGLALSPEFIYEIRPGSIFPDYQRYGVMWMGREAFGRALDMDGAFNSVMLRLAPGAGERELIDRIDRLLEPYGGQGAYGREDQRSHRFLTEELAGLETMSRIFPAIFLGVAMFLLNVVVNRLIGTQRIQVATLKAFGYGDAAVTWHYLKLVFVIVLLGAAGGLALGAWFARFMADIYQGFFHFPYLTFTMSPRLGVEAVAASLAAATLGTVAALRKVARLQPAAALQPEPPPRYRRSAVERFGIMGRLSQPSRMILRHLSRHPVKSAITVLGIAAAASITMSARFQGATVDHMMNVQFQLAQREDIAVTFVEPTSLRARHELAALDGVRAVEVQRSVPVRIRAGHRSHRTAIVGLEPGGEIQRVLDAELRPITPPEEGILLTDYLGTILGVGPGDMVLVEVLEGARPERELVVAGLVREYAGLSGYMERNALNRFMREGPAISGAWLAVDDSAGLPRIYRKLKDSPRIAGVTLRKEGMRGYEQMMQESMLFYTFVASLFSIIIAFGVVYNSARIALTERSRELASLRVLGFTRGEISYILLGELAVLTLLALPLGAAAGWLLCWAIARGLQSELYRVPLILNADAYAFAAATILVAAAASGFILRRRLDRLDLIAVLKTRD